MKTILALLLALLSVVAANGQGQFLFNTRDLAAGNNVVFSLYGGPATGTNIFVQVFAGRDQDHLTQVSPVLALNRTGSGAGYANPFAQIFTTDMPAGATAYIGYASFIGQTFDSAELVSSFRDHTFETPFGRPITVTLTAPPSPPNEVFLGQGVVIFPLPEPPSFTLCLLGIALLAVLQSRGVRL